MAIRYRPEPDDALMSQINTTPLVDVMLVLLIIFLITIPVVNSSVVVSLPREDVQVRETRPENVIVSVDAGGGIYWFDTRLAQPEQRAQRLALVAAQKPQPEVHIRGDARATTTPSAGWCSRRSRWASSGSASSPSRRPARTAPWQSRSAAARRAMRT